MTIYATLTFSSTIIKFLKLFSFKRPILPEESKVSQRFQTYSEKKEFGNVYLPSKDAYEVSYTKRQRIRNEMTVIRKGKTTLRQMV